MLTRFALFILLAIFVARAFWRLVDGIVEGASGRSRGTSTPQRGVSMVRDPVCGTFVVPERAVTIADGRTTVSFCSEACRDKYRARPSTRSGRPEPVEGRRA
jgi:YHS domain-containing protein